MNIGVVTTSYPRTEGDHAGSFVAAHVGALRAAGHTVDVIGAHTIASPLFDGGGAPDELERGGMRSYVAAARFSAQLTREVARRAADWDLIVAHWLAPSALAAVIGTAGLAPSSLARVLAVAGLAPRSHAAHDVRPVPPILAIAHGGDLHTLRRLHLLAPTLYALRARDVRLAFVSADLREVARATAPRLSSWLDAAIVQPMGIDVARFAALRATAAPSLRAKVVVVGRLVPVKGIDVAIRAMQHITSDADMVIAGDGPERAQLETLAASCVLASASVSFLGAVDAATRDRLLAGATCVVVPSRVLPNGRSEGTPMIALEALAAGVPVIASAVGGLRELPGVTHVRPDDPYTLAAAIERVLGDADVPAAADGEHLRAREADFSTADTARALAGRVALPAVDPAIAQLDWSLVSVRLLAHAGKPAAAGIGRTLSGDPAVTADARKSLICETGDTSGRRTA